MVSGIDNVKAETDRAMRQYLGDRENKMLVVRLLEACVALIVICCYSGGLQRAMMSSADHVCAVLAALNRPSFVFLIGNAIVLTIVVKSCSLFPSSESETDVQQLQQGETFASTGDPRVADEGEHVPQPPPSAAEESMVQINEQSAVCVEENVASAATVVAVSTSTVITRKSIGDNRLGFRRTPSQSLDHAYGAGQIIPHGQSRPCEALKRYHWETPRRCSAVEELSSEEFRLTVEAFIHKNRSLMRQESSD